ncbi:hypothetical protein MTR67_052208, partial [Solanum verrucosum]
FAFCSSVLSPEGKEQIGGEKEQSTYRRATPRSSATSPNYPEHDDAKGWCKTTMNYTKWQIADRFGDPEPNRCYTQDQFILESTKLGEHKKLLANRRPFRRSRQRPPFGFQK